MMFYVWVVERLKWFYDNVFFRSTFYSDEHESSSDKTQYYIIIKNQGVVLNAVFNY